MGGWTLAPHAAMDRGFGLSFDARSGRVDAYDAIGGELNDHEHDGVTTVMQMVRLHMNIVDHYVRGLV